jgi:hypothetical protein
LAWSCQTRSGFVAVVGVGDHPPVGEFELVEVGGPSERTQR